MIENNKKNRPNDLLKYTGMATQMAITILAGVFGGRKLDSYLALETPILTLVGSILGVGIALYFLIKDFIR
ncbi:AtpZ/AtpI family protein [Vicingaceae bacterium]|nr:AtpZ/AtpI family protein [Vicingaceae bacterium]